VLEFAPGGEIFDILYYTSALEPILARTYFRQSIFGLEACHNAGVAHRDIKPQNLLLDSRFNIKLTDFGLSKVFESDADAIMSTTYVGTRGYQAPELLLDKPYDLACDIFSMGVVLFILITGYPPFEQAHYSDRWFRPLAKGDYSKFWKYHAGCSISNDAKCKDLLEKMLCYDPKERITIAQIKKHEWFNGKYLEGKDLIRALRQRHREMEAKRRRDARKIQDLQVSITPNRAIGEPQVPEWNEEFPEQVLSNSYCHFEKPREFFELLSGLIGNVYSGGVEYNAEKASMICTISKMEKSTSNSNAKPSENHYKFEISLYKSKQYLLAKKETSSSNDKVDVDNQAQNDDDKYHTQAMENVYVVTTKRIAGDDYKFRGFQKKLLQDGAQIFNGLPEWAIKQDEANEENDDVIDAMFGAKDEDDAKDDSDDYDKVIEKDSKEPNKE